MTDHGTVTEATGSDRASAPAPSLGALVIYHQIVSPQIPYVPTPAIIQAVRDTGAVRLFLCDGSAALIEGVWYGTRPGQWTWPPPAVPGAMARGAATERHTAYPKHLHQAGAAEDGGPLFLVVGTAQEEAEAIADGWLLQKPHPTQGAAPSPPPPTRKR